MIADYVKAQSNQISRGSTIVSTAHNYLSKEVAKLNQLQMKQQLMDID